MKSDIVLSKLLDKYEKSKTFSNNNKVNQTFKVAVVSVFKDYENDSKPAFFRQINEELMTFEKRGFITLKTKHSNVIGEVYLVIEAINDVYKYLNRIPRKDEQNQLIIIINKYISDEDNPLQLYLHDQLSRINSNKNVEYFDEDYNEYEDVLRAVDAVQKNDKETFIRDLSIQLFKDSKRFEKLQSKICSILLNYGDFDNKETILSEYDVVKTPTYVCVKGKGQITLGDESIDLSRIKGDIAFSTETLKEISNIDISGRKIITIENLTSFHDYHDNDAFIIYLGGFHNSVKRDFIKLVYKQNPSKIYYHFGDIDAGGFYILEHLRAKTGIEFEPINMDIRTLEKYKKYWIELSKNDRIRLERIEKINGKYSETIQFMLVNNCKLEQEAEYQHL